MGNRWKWILGLCSIAVLVTGLSLAPVSDPDIWIMLSTGRQILETGHIPVSDSWSHTVFGQPWIMHEWLSSLLLFGLYRIAGFPGIIIVKILLLNTIFILGITAARKRDLKPPVVLLTFALAVLAARIGFTERLQIITFLGLAAELYLIELLDRGRISARVFLAAATLGFALWANLHLGLMAGFMVLFFYGLDRAAWGIRKKEWKPFLTVGASLALSLGAVLVNPYGFGLIKPFLTVYFDPGLKEFDSLIFKSIHEYTSIFSSSIINDAPVRWGMAWLAFSALGMILNWRKLRIFHILIWGGFFYLVFYAVRYVPLFALATMGFTAANWNEIFSRLPSPEPKTISPKHLGNAVFLSLCLFLMAVGAYSFVQAQKTCSPLGLQKDTFPVQGVQFIKENFTGEKILNDFYDGGYLVWNRIPTFIDGRLAPFQGIFGDYIRIIRGDTTLLHKYGVDLALIRYPRSGKSMSHNLPRYFSQSPEWALVFWDDVCLVFAKRSADNRALISANEYRHLNPLFPDETVPLPDFLGDLERKYREDSTCVTLYLAAFNYFYRRDLNTAEQFARQGLDLDPGNASLHNNLGNVCLTRGDLAGAVRSYLKAIELDRNFSEAYCNLGYIYETDSDYERAESYYLKVLKGIDPLNVWVYNRLGMMLAGRGEYDRAVGYLQKGASIDPRSEAAWNLRRLRSGKSDNGQ